MSDSDTPRTDAALEYTHCSCDVCDGTQYAPADFARTLELELAACQRERDKQHMAACDAVGMEIGWRKRAERAEAALEKAREAALLEAAEECERAFEEASTLNLLHGAARIRALRGAQPASAPAPAAPLAERLREEANDLEKTNAIHPITAQSLAKLLREAAAAIEAAQGDGRTLHTSDAFCPSCGHNRDKSSVSTITLRTGLSQCQKCGAQWHEVHIDAAAVRK